MAEKTAKFEVEAEAIARLREMVARHDEYAGLHDEPDGGVDDLRALLDAYDTARAEGVAAERARVVAWLRAADSETLVWFAAQRIEQGWHDKEGE